GVGVNFGAEYRRDAESFQPDAATNSGDLSGFGGAIPTIDESYDVTEGFGEVRVPIAQQKFLLDDLVFDAGYRYSSYSNAGLAHTYKLGLQGSPTEDVRFRGSYQRATRAPNLIDLFLPQAVTNTSIVSVDPCGGATPTATAAQCANTGVTAAQYGHII